MKQKQPYIIKDKEFKYHGFDIANNEIPYIDVWIDGMNLFIRSFKRTYGTLNDSNNRDVGGLLQSLRFVFGLISNYEKSFPHKVFYNIMFEKGKSQSHAELNKEYKQNRIVDTSVFTEDELKDYLDEKDNFKSELDQFKTIMQQLSNEINCLNVYYSEGDFVIRKGIDYYQYVMDKYKKPIIHLIVSSDNDFKQLLSDETPEIVFIYDSYKKTMIHKYNYDNFYDIKPHHIIFQKQIQGDKSDNIQGLSKYGPKKQQQVIDSIHDKITTKMTKEDIKEQITTSEFPIKTMKSKLLESIDILYSNYKMVNIVDINNVDNMVNSKTQKDTIAGINKYVDDRIHGKHENMFIHEVMKILSSYDIVSMSNYSIIQGLKTSKINL